MNKNLQNIEDLYKKLIEEHAEVPPATVWDNINKKLDEKKIILLKRKYTDLRKLTAILLVSFISALAYYYGSDKKISYEKAAGTEETISKPKANLNSTTDSNLQLTSKKIIIITKKDTLKNKFTEELLSKINNEDSSIERKNKTVKKEISFEKNKIENDKLFEINRLIKTAKKTQHTETLFSIKNNLKTTSKKLAVVKLLKEQNERDFAKKIPVPFTEQMEALSLMQQPVANKYTALSSKKNKRDLNQIKADNTLNKINNNDNEHQKIISIISKVSVQPLLTNNLKVTTIKVAGLKEAPLSFSKKYNQSARRKFSISIYASPEVAFNRMEDDQKDVNRGPQGNNRPPDDRHKIKKEEQCTKSFSSGILVNYSFNNNWSLQSGISLISKSSKTEPKKVFAERDDNGNIKYKYNCAFGSSFISPKAGSAPVIGDSAIANAISNNIMYVGVPLNFSYLLKKGKLQISPIAGITFNFLVKQGSNTDITAPSGSQKESGRIINGLKSNYINANFGMDISYWLNKKIGLTLIPSTLIALNSVNQNSPVKSYPNSLGIKAGLKLNF